MRRLLRAFPKRFCAQRMAGCGLSEDACFSSFFYNYTSSWETSYNQVRGGRCCAARSPPLRPPCSSGEAKVVPVCAGRVWKCFCSACVCVGGGNKPRKETREKSLFPCAFQPPSLRPPREEEEREEG